MNVAGLFWWPLLADVLYQKFGPDVAAPDAY